ncbi:hypothetical protein M406DRAFT_288811 [Cryphonectria parasitica EP155]|uniref:Uncharacterized protein n=1 Tax=Cryphonectria parasitica (strain ATCC 38755 / EP155) TaxID=660469 RepID=A0A9P5CQY2_CRYP1|nr:uncharacterized protein M406DRAFT_288811 [Cryphonectria parasitica EP155]KAF3767673.1 hypothetical protein M406DRAFT_288811 [Cryphonectria parasitica EP155]
MQGITNMIERFSHVQDRSSAHSAKRRKVEEEPEDDKSKNGAFHGGSSGMLSGYLKQKQSDTQSTSLATTPTQSTLDLTGGMCDDDDLEEIKDPREQEVCYGMVAGAMVHCHIVPSPKPGARTLTPGSWPQVKVVLRRIEGDKTRTINVYDHTRTIVGKLNPKIAAGLAPLFDARLLGIRTDAFIGTRRRLPDEEAGQHISRSYPLQLMLYGKFKYAKTVAKHFSRAEVNINLLSPTRVDKGVRVFNPLAKELRPMSAPRAYDQPQAAPVARTEEEVRSEILNVFDSLADTDKLPESEPDDRITTPLLPHQKQALHFMKGREDPAETAMDPLWKKTSAFRGQVTYYNIIASKHYHEPPTKPLGGILADMMGLGKTLSILSLVASTVPDAYDWARTEPALPETTEQPQPQNPFAPPKPGGLGLTTVKRNSKGTLLVCPLSTITNWEEQIKQHIRPGGLTYHIYHGPHRIKDLNQLATYDLVITTYGSVSSELSARSANKRGPHPLEEIGWFRIVLDEAHMIREQSTLQFKAIYRLNASRRWAVTGTPVQNKLEDLASLLAFLRVKPFHDRSMFNQYIVTPFKMCDTGIIPKLRLLVDTITLRRMKDKIDLPKRHDQIVKLQFSAEERRMYEAFQKDAQLRVSVITGQRERMVGGKTYIHILQAILRLRLFCSGGKDLMSEDDLHLLEGSSSEAPIDIDSDEDDEKPALTESKAYDMFNLMQDANGDNCIICSQKLGPKEGSEIESERQEEVMGYMTPCYHLLCPSCIGNFQGLCPCGAPVLSTVALRLTKADQEHEAHSEGNNGKVAGKMPREYSGPNTKVKYLIQELHSWKAKSIANPHEPPYKSVVFSQWTTNLDLIQKALDVEGISYVRLDGKMTRIGRTRAMDSFREDPNVQIILVSITAGGLGLNLTAGNSVYIMEPLFNPAAEAQAIDRVHRLGQKREVHCVRMLMDDSFEEKMRELQEKKMKLASLSMDRDKGDAGGYLTKAEAAKQRLMDLRSLFEKGSKL